MLCFCHICESGVLRARTVILGCCKKFGRRKYLRRFLNPQIDVLCDLQMKWQLKNSSRALSKSGPALAPACNRGAKRGSTAKQITYPVNNKPHNTTGTGTLPAVASEQSLQIPSFVRLSVVQSPLAAAKLRVVPSSFSTKSRILRRPLHDSNHSLFGTSEH